MTGFSRALVAVVVLAACSSSTVTAPPTSTTRTSTSTTSDPAPASTTVAPPTTRAPEQVVRTGSQVLVDDGFELLEGQRVGLIAHQASLVESSHLADLMDLAPNVELVALFSPEHGVRGDADAGEYVADEVDGSTGAPVFSLFGPTRQPTPEMLENVDVLVYDLQDVGTRYYTYISTMGLAMQAAAQADIDFVVLDRPNPLGGQVGGGVLETENTSFVGLYPVPDTYGLTAGELALSMVDGRLLSGIDDLSLTIVEMDGWDRSMLWADTGLAWIAPSPAMTSPDAALLYPATIYFESLSLSYGRGTDTPFQVIGAPWLDADALVRELSSRQVAGIAFDATTITPEMLDGMTVEPAYLGKTIPAVRLTVTDQHALRPTEAGIHLLDAVFTHAAIAGVDPLARPAWLDQLSGSTFLQDALTSRRIDADDIILEQREQQAQWAAGRAPTRLYD